MHTPHRLAWLSCLALGALACGPSVPTPQTTPPPPSASVPPVASASASAAVAPPKVTAEPDVPSPAELQASETLIQRASQLTEAYSNYNAHYLPRSKRFVFRSNRTGLGQLYVADPALPSQPPLQITQGIEPVTGCKVLPDGRSVLFLLDKGRDENFSIYRVAIDGSGLTELTPGETLHRDEPFLPEGRAKTMAYSARSPKESTTRVYVQGTDPGSAPKLVYTDPSPGFLVDVTRDGKKGLFIRINTLSDSSLWLLDLDKGASRRVYPVEGKTAFIHSAAFAMDNARAFVSTDMGEEKSVLLSVDLASLAERARYVETNPPTGPIEDITVGKRGNRIAVRVNSGNHHEVRILDALSLRALIPNVSLPPGSGSIDDFSDDGQRVSVTWSTPDIPSEVYSVDARTGTIQPLRKEARPTLDSLPKIRTQLESVSSFDGTKVPLNIYLPDTQTPPTALPVIVSVHGGPAASSEVRWNPMVRFFASLGYAVVEPNIRGSSGFGRAYEQADNGPKRLDALKDLEAVARWVRQQSWADPQRLVVYGGSYGGYMVLMALTHQQELWAAGIDAVGPSNWRSFMASTSGDIRKVLSEEFGSVEKDGPFLDSISPIRQIDQIRAPLFVYQGQNDPRVPRPESDQVVLSLRQRQVPVEYMVAANEGHSLDRRETRIAFFSRIARFLDKHLPAKH